MYSAVYAVARCLSVRPSSICVCLSVTLIGVRKDPDIFPWDSFSRTVTIRYDTIEEINVDSKAEYTA